MQYTVAKGEKGKVEIKVDISKAQFEEAFNQVLAQFAKDVKIAGFRPGKAPSDVLESHVGLGKILNEAASLLISKHLAEIFKKENLMPLDSPNVAVNSLAKDAPFSFTTTFTPKPKVTVGNWRTIKVKKVKAREITEKDVADSIKNIFDAWEKRKGPEGQSDKGTEDIKGSATAEDTESQSGKFIYDAHGNKIYIKDEKELKSNRVRESKKIKAVKIDDEFAKQIGARDLIHLQEIVKKDLETLVTNQVEAKFEQEIFDEIVKICTIEVPEILVEDELNRILVRLNSQLAQQKKSLEDFFSEQKTTIEELKAKWRPQAENNVKISLIIDQIGKAEKIQVQREEIDRALTSINQTNLSDEQKKDLEKYLAFSIFQAKTLDLVKKTIVE
ncbi:hypothetical protein A2165_00765 [Candidatus Curtissbacteria bacterium RBG_13_40_7]|uniref:Trigger factor n=1 Tax=Candidatus Curtissbacteria bacterium RBG_13_40_7 TaxID=1797706 RepID=A0A1F5FUE9_9BACT|nr:MAG: hypothetical protein A2165_00765 [Candidatus Curtissbacteria bacterium RBG_13_40_7]